MGEAQGKKIANEPLRVKVGERSERIVARDPPAKGRYGRGRKQQWRAESTGSAVRKRRCDAAGTRRSAMHQCTVRT
jgi:hypothetical protein